MKTLQTFLKESSGNLYKKLDHKGMERLSNGDEVKISYVPKGQHSKVVSLATVHSNNYGSYTYKLANGQMISQLTKWNHSVYLKEASKLQESTPLYPEVELKDLRSQQQHAVKAILKSFGNPSGVVIRQDPKEHRSWIEFKLTKINENMMIECVAMLAFYHIGTKYGGLDRFQLQYVINDINGYRQTKHYSESEVKLMKNSYEKIMNSKGSTVVITLQSGQPS